MFGVDNYDPEHYFFKACRRPRKCNNLIAILIKSKSLNLITVCVHICVLEVECFLLVFLYLNHLMVMGPIYGHNSSSKRI